MGGRIDQTDPCKGQQKAQAIELRLVVLPSSWRSELIATDPVQTFILDNFQQQTRLTCSLRCGVVEVGGPQLRLLTPAGRARARAVT